MGRYPFFFSSRPRAGQAGQGGCWLYLSNSPCRQGRSTDPQTQNVAAWFGHSPQPRNPVFTASPAQHCRDTSCLGGSHSFLNTTQIQIRTRTTAVRAEGDLEGRKLKCVMSGSPKAQLPTPPTPSSLLCPCAPAQLRALTLCPGTSSRHKLGYARNSTFPYSLNHRNLASRGLNCQGYSNSILLTSLHPCPQVPSRSLIPKWCLDAGERFWALASSKTPWCLPGALSQRGALSPAPSSSVPPGRRADAH